MTLSPSPGTLASARPVSSGPTGGDCIVINDLRVMAFVGVHDFEHGARQSVRFDVRIEAVADYMRIVRETGDYISYADTVAYVTDRANSDEHVELVETWAEDVAAFALHNPLVKAVTVRVTKPDIFEHAAGVGIEITRQAPVLP